MWSNDGWGMAVAIFALICALVGWAVIEFFLWLLSFIHVSFGK